MCLSGTELYPRHMLAHVHVLQPHDNSIALHLYNVYLMTALD